MLSASGTQDVSLQASWINSLQAVLDQYAPFYNKKIQHTLCQRIVRQTLSHNRFVAQESLLDSFQASWLEDVGASTNRLGQQKVGQKVGECMCRTQPKK